MAKMKLVSGSIPASLMFDIVLSVVRLTLPVAEARGFLGRSLRT